MIKKSGKMMMIKKTKTKSKLKYLVSKENP